jgi:hypothetical protein
MTFLSNNVTQNPPTTYENELNHLAAHLDSETTKRSEIERILGEIKHLTPKQQQAIIASITGEKIRHRKSE